MELLVAIAIIGILASLALGVMFSAQQAAREHHTRSLVTKLHTQMMIRWESYRTRRLPLALDPSSNDVNAFSLQLLMARRELMRMELPDRYKDLLFDPVAYVDDDADPIRPSVWFTYRQRLESVIGPLSVPLTAAQKTAILARADDHQSAECLYMIMTTAMESDNTGRALFGENDVADIDGDGMPEFIDGWGNPIEWIRWPAGFVSDLQPVVIIDTVDTRDPATNHDPFDPRRLDTYFTPVGPSWPPDETEIESNNPPPRERGFRLFPLIMSPGPDAIFGLFFFQRGMVAGEDVHITTQPGDSDPYMWFRQPADPMQPGAIYARALPIESDFGGHLDNVDNHSLETR